jgi:hypothetical protein
MMRREGDRVVFDLSDTDADLLLLLPRETVLAGRLYLDGEGRHTFSYRTEAYNLVLMALGFAAGKAQRDGDLTKFWAWIKLANTINEGNPRFTPYKIPEPEAAKPESR